MFWARIFSLVCFVAAFDASAQIIIDFDVLDTIDEQVPAKATPEKKESSKTQKKPQKQPKKQPQKQPLKNDKYQVVESEKQDEHDKLKPRSNPVPVVKVISSDVKKETPKEQKTPKKAAVAKKTAVPAVKKAQKPAKPQPPKKAEKPTVAIVEKMPVVVPETVKENVPEPEKTTASDKIVQAQDAVEKIVSHVMQKNAEEKKASETVQQNTDNTVPADVFAVPENYSAAQRSAFLADKLPVEAAGVRTLTEKTLLHDVILFEKDLIDFTSESQKKAADLATFLTENPSKRVIVFTYAAPSKIDAGRERQLTLRRALALRSFLAQSNVRTVRIEIRSQGTKGAGESYPDRAEILVYDR